MSSIEICLQLKNEFDALRPLSQEDELRIMQKLRLDWNYHSNNLEGNTLTYGETKALILFGITAQGKPLKDHFEVTGHDEAIKWVQEIVKQGRPLTEKFIRELHKLILKQPYEVDAITPEGHPTKKKVNLGVYKTTPNHVRTNKGEIFRFATPEETPALMKDLLEWYKKKANAKEVNPILLAAEFHYRFIRIHPFDDGNGRTARILMNFILMQFGFPPVIIKTDDKQNYFAALRQADSGQISPFIDYIADNLIHSLEIMIKGAKGENIEEPDDIDKEIALLDQKIKTVGEAIEISKSKESLLQLYDNTISKVAARFIEKGEQFEKFYVDSEFRIWVDGGGSVPEEKDREIINARERLKSKTKSISIQYKYDSFNRIGFQEFDHTSLINFSFHNTGYSVKDNPGKLEYKKPYGEDLTDSEINSLVKSEIKAHKNFIEQKIEEIKKK